MSSPRWTQSNVCIRCAKIKQVCDGKTPCSRCARLSVPCEPRSSKHNNRSVTTDHDQDELTPTPPKARIRRVQTGCLRCKKRKKKCDEQKPRCGDCVRLQLDCVWPSDRRRDANGMEQGGGFPLLQTASSVMDGFEYTETLCEGVPALLQLSGLSSRSNGAIASDGGVVHDPWADDALFDFSLSPIDLQWDLTKDSTASGTTTSLGGSAVGSVLFSATSPDQGSLNLYIPSLMPNLTSADDKALFNHYSAVVANALCRTSQSSVSNPYILHILPMAVSDDTIRHCVLALSGSHWKRTQPRLSERGLVHQAKATQALAGMLSTTSQQTTDVALAACLLLCLNEILDGQSSGWKHHLEGAKRLMAARATADVTDMASEYAFLVDLARFLDSATTTSTCAPPVMQKDDTNAAFLSRLSFRLSNHDTAVYGVPKALFHLVDKINNLAQKRKTRIDAQSEDSFLQETALTEDLLDHWSFEYGGLSQAVASLTSLSLPDHDTLQATIAYEWALRLRLHQIRDGYKLSHDFVPRCVGKILGAVQEIRYGSPLEGCLLFPLVMAGGACEGLEQRIIIQDRLMVMERTYGFGYVYCARDLVEKVWEQRDALEGTGAIVNWARMRFEEMSGLVIF